MDMIRSYLAPVLTLAICTFAFICALTGSKPSKTKMLVILGAVLNIVATVGGILFYRFLLPKMENAGNNALMWDVSSILFTLLHAAGLLMFVLAAFADRKSKTFDRDRDDRDDRPRRPTRRDD